VAEKMDINLIWFGILLAMNLQTSFLTPPFGFALFYLRSVAARNDYNDEVTGKRIAAVTTAQIYKGSIAFIILQVIMVGVILFNPQLVTGNLDAPVEVDAETVRQQLMDMGGGGGNDAWGNDDPWAEEEGAGEAGSEGANPAAEAGEPGAQESDPAKALEEAVRRSAQ
jgi:hypothetical protein